MVRIKKRTTVIKHKRKIPSKKRPITITKHRRDLTTNLPKSLKRKVNNEYWDLFGSELKKKGRVNINSIGTFTIKRVKAKKGGKKMYSHLLKRDIITKPKPASKLVKFRPSKSFKQKL